MDMIPDLFYENNDKLQWICSFFKSCKNKNPCLKNYKNSVLFECCRSIYDKMVHFVDDTNAG